MAKATNAGVHTNIGMDFQKNCALFILLEKYLTIKDKHYFIILEHYDDIIFGFLNDRKKLERIEAFQVKKSAGAWRLSQLYEIIKKIIDNGVQLRGDPIVKSKGYIQTQYFGTNDNISIKLKEKKIEYGELVNETNSDVSFISLDKKVQDDLRNKLSTKHSCLKIVLDELDNLNFKFIDLGKKSESQRQQLIGKFQSLFTTSVNDHQAAVDTILRFFHESESTPNQGGVAQLSDLSKRIESNIITQIFGILTSKKKAYDLWRAKADEISKALKISVNDRDRFKLDYENSFDMFKDLKEQEHQKILNFVKGKKSEFGKFHTDVESLEYLSTSFLSGNSTQLTMLQMNAAIYAAYNEIKG